MSCFFPWRHVLFMITTDEKRWPWQSSDVTKEGIDIWLLSDTNCFWFSRMNSSMACVLLILFLSLALCFVCDRNRWETLAMAVVRRYQGRYAYIDWIVFWHKLFLPKLTSAYLTLGERLYWDFPPRVATPYLLVYNVTEKLPFRLPFIEN